LKRRFKAGYRLSPAPADIEHDLAELGARTAGEARLDPGSGVRSAADRMTLRQSFDGHVATSAQLTEDLNKELPVGRGPSKRAAITSLHPCVRRRRFSHACRLPVLFSAPQAVQQTGERDLMSKTKLSIALVVGALAIVLPLSALLAAKKGACGEFKHWRDGRCVDARQAPPTSWPDAILSKQWKP
jgi:hypothetical protein